MRDDRMNCEAIQQAIRDGRGLAKVESAHLNAHLDECDACMDAWLTVALDTKPEVVVPADFAARVAAMVPARQEKRVTARTPRHWGVISAMAFVTVMLAVCFMGPKPDHSWVGLVFVMLVASEIAGLALWLGPRWMGR
jgi:predicted anti-sigma-YlaC factor YlaD